MAKKELSELKKRALLAKQRLKMGYWQKMEREHAELIIRLNGDKGNANQITRRQLERDTLMAVDSKKAKEDELFYARVCSILDADEDTTNPIGQLIDKDLYATLDDGGRQRYVLEISKKFKELSARYYLEQKAKSRANQ